MVSVHQKGKCLHQVEEIARQNSKGNTEAHEDVALAAPHQNHGKEKVAALLRQNKPQCCGAKCKNQRNVNQLTQKSLHGGTNGKRKGGVIPKVTHLHLSVHPGSDPEASIVAVASVSQVAQGGLVNVATDHQVLTSPAG